MTVALGNSSPGMDVSELFELLAESQKLLGMQVETDFVALLRILGIEVPGWLEIVPGVPFPFALIDKVAVYAVCRCPEA